MHARMWKELWRRRSVRIILFLVTVLVILQYSVNFFSYSRSLPELVRAKLLELGWVGHMGELSEKDAIRVVFTVGDVDYNRFLQTNNSPIDTIAQDLIDESSMPNCPPFPPDLVGVMPVSKRPVRVDVINAKYAQYFNSGGFYAPPDCKASQKVALVIPFRDRDEHLYIFLNHLIPMLMRQQLEFTIYVVDQARGSKFNRGMLMNIGFAEALKDKNYTCFVFHDVDLLPENDHNIYSCSARSPRHMSAAVDKFDYKLPYAAIFGGVSAIKRDHFLRVNGFSNAYFGWGAEDDDMYRRIKRQGLKLTRYPLTIARYTMLSHGHEGNKAAPDRFVYLNGKGGEARLAFDGVNSLRYEVVDKHRNHVYTKVVVRINQNEIRGTLEKKLYEIRTSWWSG